MGKHFACRLSSVVGWWALERDIGCFFFQAEDGIRDLVRSRGLGDVYKRQTSAFAPRYYPQAIIDYANTRGADKIIYAGYFPAGLTYDRIFSELPDVAFKDEVWPKFLRTNAERILGLS